MIRLSQGLDPTSSRTLLCASIMSGISGVSCWRQQPRLGEVITAITAALLSLSFLLLSLSPLLFSFFSFLKKNQTYRKHLLFIHHFSSTAVDILLDLFCFFSANIF